MIACELDDITCGPVYEPPQVIDIIQVGPVEPNYPAIPVWYIGIFVVLIIIAFGILSILQYKKGDL